MRHFVACEKCPPRCSASARLLGLPAVPRPGQRRCYALVPFRQAPPRPATPRLSCNNRVAKPAQRLTPPIQAGDNAKITTGARRLTLRNRKNEKKEEKDNYTRKEFSRSSFIRTFTLPSNVVEDNITAGYKDGLLSIELKKSDKELPAKKQIKVS